MALPRLCFLGLLLCLFSSPAIAATQADFFYLTLMWPGTCSFIGGDCCMPTTGVPAADFLVQSLETHSSITGNEVTNCSSSCRFLINPMVDLIEDLFSYWPSLDCPSNNGRDQWEKVWCTYGTCSNLTQVVYFNRTLRLREQVDVLNVLGSQGIVPSTKKIYDLENIQDALVPKSSAVVECTKSGSYLSHIRICISIDGSSVIGCPIRKPSSCGSKVRFLPVHYALHDGHGDAAAAGANPIKLPTDKDMVL